MTATPELIKDMQSHLADLDRRIKDLQAARAPLLATRQGLQEQIDDSDEEIRLRGPLGDSAKRARARVYEAMGGINRDISSIDVLLSPLQEDRRRAEAALAEALKPPITPQSLQSAIDSAQATLEALQAKRPAALAALTAALAKRAEVDSLDQSERQAEDALKDARTEAFMSSSVAGKKRDAANEAITAADMALSVAREKADTGRAALPRIESLIERGREDLESLDAEIQAAQSAVKARQQAKDLHEARTAWNAAADTMVVALARFQGLDSGAFHLLRDGLRNSGIKVFDSRNRLDTPAGLKWGEEFVL